jgi:hypothetical protein
LASGTLYYYRTYFYNQSNGEYKYGPVQQFTTPATPVTTDSATNVTSFSATLSGTVTSGGAQGTAYMQFSTFANFVTFGSTSSVSITAVTGAQTVSGSTTTAGGGWQTLASGTLYYYRTFFYNQSNGEYRYGPVKAFQTLAIPKVVVSPYSSNVISTETIIVTVAVSGNSGTPTGSIALTGGGYLSPATPLINGMVSILIPAGSLPVGSDTLSANYAPDSLSYSVYSNATGTSSVTVAAAKETTVFLNANGAMGALGAGGTSKISPTNGGGLSSGASSVAIDGNGDIWIADKSSVVEFNTTGSVLSGSGYSGGGLGGTANLATSIAVDGYGNVWVSNSNGTLTWLSNNGAPPPVGINGGGMSTPSAIAVDNAGTVWVTNSGNNSVTRVFGAAAPVVTPLATGNADGSLGVRP